MHTTSTSDAVRARNERTPVLPGDPFIGHIRAFRRTRIAIQLQAAAFGDVVRMRMGPKWLIALSSAEAAQALLVDHAGDVKKSVGLAKFGRPLLGEGLLTSELDFHKRQRKLLAPAFAPKRIAQYASIMAALTEKAITRWRLGDSVDASEEMMRLTLSIVGKTLFDADTEGDARVVGEALTDGMQYMVDSITSLPALLLPYSFPTPSNQRMRKAVARLDEVIYRIIAERRASAAMDRGDVLSVLIAARDEDDGTGMTDSQMRDEAMTLMLAGHETTANTLAWTWYLLGTHPEAQDRVVAEVRAVCGGKTPTFEDLPRMPYVAQVIKESMRLYPPAYIVVREAQRPFEINGHAINKGEMPFVNIFGIHRRADYYPQPNAFRPERFEPAQEKALPRGAFIPFGAGPRVCIGNHFAAMEAQIVLATIAQRVRFELVSTQEPEMEPMVTLRPRGGLAVRVHAR